METMSHHPKAANISPDALELESSWDAALFLLGRYGLMDAQDIGRPLSQMAEVFEGSRDVRDTDGASSCYKGSSISGFEISPTREQWRMTQRFDQETIRVGDVLLKRVSPISAAIVSLGLPMLPVDGNFFVIRGLDQANAWWVAFCLNHPAIADYLLSKSGRGVLSRVALSVLRSWKVPQAAVQFLPLTRRMGELLQKRVFISGQIASLETDVEQAVADQMASTGYDDSEQRFSQKSWSFFFPASSMDASWLPIHVATEYRTEVLEGDRDWQPLRSCLLPEAPARNRFSHVDEPISVLRLSDVGEIPLVPDSLEASIPSQFSRVFRHPVEAEEVLLSTLGSSPRVAFAPINLHPPVYAVDHWERLRFRSHAAAYALILQTGAITRQLRSLASGSVQQFIRPEDIQRLFLPVHDDETLTQWDRSFRSLCKAWLQTDSEWQTVLREGWLVVSRAFNSPQKEASESSQ